MFMCYLKWEMKPQIWDGDHFVPKIWKLTVTPVLLFTLGPGISKFRDWETNKKIELELKMYCALIN